MQRLLILFILLANLVVVTPLVAQTQGADCRKVARLIQTLEKQHVQPVELNDQISEALFIDFLTDLDPDGLYFLEQDISELAVFRDQLDEELGGGPCKFVEAVEKVYRRALLRADSLARSLLDEPLDLGRDQTLVLQKPGTFAPLKDEATQRDLWEKYLKYSVLNRLFSPLDSTDRPEQAEIVDLLKREPEARAYARKRLVRNHQKRLQPRGGFRAELYNTWLNAIAALYDPHSEYFSPDEKMLFDIILSKQNYAFGFSLRETRSGDFKVARIAPGGPAWRSNGLHEGDIVVGCTISGEQPMDLSELDLQDFEETIDASAVRTVTLSLRKSDGRLQTVTLRKEKMEEDGEVVRGLMLEGSEKVGYIALPGFYAASDNDPQSGCGNDVAREVIKLKREGMTGLILDLRNNGGGSVLEAAELAGIFLDYGPLFLRTDQSASTMSVKDPNRGYAWKGPLVVLVNGLSASASELVSGALQDYHRAVIVGSTTFGKSTGQIVVSVPGTGDFLKLTTSKFNRVTGESYQLAGLKPDVSVPDIYEGLDYREASYPHALPGTPIEGNKYFSPGDPLPLEDLRSKSLDRIDNDTRFVRFSSFSGSMRKALEYPMEIPLKIEAFRNFEAERRDLLEDWGGMFSEPVGTFKVQLAQVDRELMESNDFRRETYQALMEKIAKDFIVEEGYQIILDLKQ